MSAQVVPLRQVRARSQTLSDEAVAAACSTGDPTAVAELFERFHQPVTRFLFRMVGQSSDVEDLVQSTFMEVARGKARFDGRSAVRTWVFGIAANVARHHFRGRSRHNRLKNALLSAAGWSSREPGAPDKVSDARQRLGRVAQAMDQLPLEMRAAFVMCEIEGLSAKEAGKALHASETAIWKRVSKARKALKRAASEEES